MEKKLRWIGFEVPTREATWVCVESSETEIPMTADGIEYSLVFAARPSHIEGTPANRRLRLRTSSFKVGEPEFLRFLSLVVEGQLIETTPWDRFKEVYEQD